MSWAGFRKAINRGGTQVLMRAGYIDTTIDPKYDGYKQTYRALEKEAVKLQKHTKGYLDCMRQINTSQSNIVETLDSLHDDEPSATITEYLQVIHTLSSSFAVFDNAYRESVHQPIVQFNNYFRDINQAMSARNQKKLDYDIIKNKVKRLEDKKEGNSRHMLYKANVNIDDQLRRFEKELSMTQSAYETLNNQLKNELPKLIELRKIYIETSFEAFVKLQMDFCNQNYISLNEIQNVMDKDSRHDYATGKVGDKVDDVLIRMNQLNITCNNAALAL
ncbi:hypothetical protein DASC09_034110 [Saccharomycopsis crataegensis]|uniref:BAR domain-containing protein n=1 Tax=Saccharomycopsis crataegensis TaxID=43959 RepID=A0AAV5QN04_9ASCO|nr:hypothetical protein DASC09_034110 [Saccharomycopsis crataegensis]